MSEDDRKKWNPTLFDINEFKESIGLRKEDGEYRF